MSIEKFSWNEVGKLSLTLFLSSLILSLLSLLPFLSLISLLSLSLLFSFNSKYSLAVCLSQEVISHFVHYVEFSPTAFSFICYQRCVSILGAPFSLVYLLTEHLLYVLLIHTNLFVSV